MQPTEIDAPTIVIRPASLSYALHWRELIKFRQVFFAMVIRNTKLQFRSRALNLIWPIAQPLLVTGIFMFLRRATNADPAVRVAYPLYVFSGLMLWNYFSKSVTEVASSLRREAGLLKKIYFPRVLVPAVPVAQNLSNLVIAVLPITVMMIYFGQLPSWTILLTPILLLQVMALSMGIGCIWAAVSVYAEDLDQILGLALYIAFFLSPVLFSLHARGELIQTLLTLNPMSGALMAFRACLFREFEFPVWAFTYSLVVSVGCLAGGLSIFRRLETVLADRL